MDKPLVSVVIVNWNGEAILQECLSFLFTQNYRNIQVIVLDNNSTDKSKEIIKNFKKVEFIESDNNLGFAQGNNVACAKAKGEYVLLLNNDAIVTKNFLKHLVAILEKDKNIGIVQPKILYKGNPSYIDNTVNSIGAFFTPTGFLYYPGYGKKFNLSMHSRENEIFSAYGACMLIRKKLIDKIGLFDSDFFLYFEETDFCLRAHLAGYKVICTPKSFVYHRGGVSARKFGDEKIFFHSFKNRVSSYIKNFEVKTLIRILPLHLLIYETTAVIYLLTGRIRLFLVIQKAIFWNLTNLPKTLGKRNIIQKNIRKVKDSMFLTKVSRSPRLSYYLYLFKGLEYYKD